MHSRMEHPTTGVPPATAAGTTEPVGEWGSGEAEDGRWRRPLAARAALLPLALVALAALAVLVAAGPAAAAPPVEVDTLVAELDGAVGGVAVDRLGNVYVADFGDKVWKVTPWGEVEVFAEGFYGSSGNAVDPEGDLLQSSFHGDYLDRVHRDGRVERVASGLEGPVGVAVGGDGTLYVTNCRGNWIARVGEDGEVSEHARSDLFACPNGLTRDGDDNLYALNFRDPRLLKVTPEGEVSVHATLPGVGGGHVVFTGGELYATTFRGNQLHRVGLDGSVETVAGTGAFGTDDGPGPEASFSTPNGISFDAARGILYINDYLVPFPQRQQVRPVSSLRRVRLPSLAKTLTSALEEGGIGAMREAYHQFKEGLPAFTELQMNAFGYQLLQAGKVEAALAAFELNAESYPNSFNVWDSLAEAHRAAGHRERAVELYRRSLEINPGNANALRLLEEMGAEP